LEAVEDAGVKDVGSAEALALAAYADGDMKSAVRWIKRARQSPVTQWLEAKLLLRDGKVREAASLLSSLVPQFPILRETTNAPAITERKDTLVVTSSMPESRCMPDSADRRIRGELGVLHLARGEYRQALDALLSGGYWMDAAYVAERVLTLDELKEYVDSFWPAADSFQEAREREDFGETPVCPAKLRADIRYLLARRLTREMRGDLAREYYPAAWVEAFDDLALNLRDAWDESAAAFDRAGALFRAALITRTNGMELIGTELEPDWHYHDGQFDFGLTIADRYPSEPVKINRASEDETQRYAQHTADPELRFHYRYQAASLAWESAKLLPDNTDLTAYVLWTGGSFLKNRDPQTADIFYKALVLRNRKTVLGAEADRRRWFPPMDESGNIIPIEKNRPFEIPEPMDEETTETAVEEAMEPLPEETW